MIYVGGNIIAFILENLVIGKINHILLEKFADKSDSKISKIHYIFLKYSVFLI